MTPRAQAIVALLTDVSAQAGATYANVVACPLSRDRVLTTRQSSSASAEFAPHASTLRLALSQDSERRRFAPGAARCVVASALIALCALPNLSCEAQDAHDDEMRTETAISAYRDRLLDDYADEAADAEASPGSVESALRQREPLIQLAAAQSSPDDARSERLRRAERALLVDPASSYPVPTTIEILREVPDPSEAGEVFGARLKALEDGFPERRVAEKYGDVVDQALKFLERLERPNKRYIGLEECIQRALQHSYVIRAASFDPAIEGTAIVEAQAAFDAVFFLDTSLAITESPSLNPQLVNDNEQSDQFGITGGIRQLLPTGMTAQVGLGLNRNFVDNERLPPETNPIYVTSFDASLTQPLLRGFGLNVNRAGIEIARANRAITYWQFIADVRDQLFAVEQAYWNLVLARRTVAVLAESVAQNLITAEDIKARIEHDATEVEVANSEAQFLSRFTDYLESVKIAKDSEDALKNLLNDPELLLAIDEELVPTDLPLADPVIVDQFAEVRTSLEWRSEIFEARRVIDTLRINTSVQKNNLLPQLDLTFQYSAQGIGTSGADAFEQTTGNEFESWTVAVNFSYPIGNRAAEAGYREAQLREAQAVVRLKQVIDGVVQEVNNAVRDIQLRYSQLPSQLRSVLAGERNLRALQARTSQITPSFLQTELQAVEGLSNDRINLLRVIVDYNVSLVELERSKGTLLSYNNVVLSDRPTSGSESLRTSR